MIKCFLNKTANFDLLLLFFFFLIFFKTNLQWCIFESEQGYSDTDRGEWVLRIDKRFDSFMTCKKWLLTIRGENSQIPRFGKICGKLAQFRKYLPIYHFFSTRVPQNRVLNSTQVQWTRVPSGSPAWHCWPRICVIKKIMWYSILLKSSISL